MTSTKQIRIRIDKQKAKLYEQTLKDTDIKMKDDIDRYISEVIRTKGLRARELLGNELKAQSDFILNQVKIDRINLQEYYTDSLVTDVLKALARKASDGTNRQLTDDSIEYFMKKISEAHKVPTTSVLTCMRQQLYNIYQDNNGELDRILRIIDRIQDTELKVLV